MRVLEPEAESCSSTRTGTHFSSTVTTGRRHGAGSLAEDVADGWLAERRGEEGRFFAAMTHFLASATRP